MMGLCVLIITLFLPKQARFRFEYERGKVWMQKDLFSPYSFAIRKTNAEIEKDRQDILKSVLPIYQNDPELAQNAIDALNSEFEIKWKTSGQPNSDKALYNAYANTLLHDIYQRGIFDEVKKYQRDGPNYNFSLLTNNVSTQLNTADALTLDRALAYIKSQLQKNPQIKNKD